MFGPIRDAESKTPSKNSRISSPLYIIGLKIVPRENES